MDKETNKFRGMATVRFEHPIESVQAICILNFNCLRSQHVNNCSFSRSYCCTQYGMILLSVCPSVWLWQNVLWCSWLVFGVKCCVPWRALPIHFFRHFCFRMYQHMVKIKLPKFLHLSIHEHRGDMTMAILGAVFSVVQFFSCALYAVWSSFHEHRGDMTMAILGAVFSVVQFFSCALYAVWSSFLASPTRLVASEHCIMKLIGAAMG